MGHAIHHRIIDGKPVYRVWSTVVDSYVSEELTLEEVKQFEIEHAVEQARAGAIHGIEFRLKRAHETGSSGFAVPELTQGQWKKEGPLGPEEDE